MIARARKNAIVTVNGRPTTVRKGSKHDADSELVKRHPWLFEVDNVEEARARPGERRQATTRRRRQ